MTTQQYSPPTNYTQATQLLLETYQSEHLAEFANSAIAPEIISLNFESVGQEQAFSLLVKLPLRRNDGRLVYSRWLKDGLFLKCYKLHYAMV